MQIPCSATRRRHMLSALFFAALVWLPFLSYPAPALADAPQQTSPVKRPKIGLVLGGGGARGSAHVGVLKVLEELRIPIDYIAGTSMGAIVGGLYAAGLTPDEIGHELKTIDWDDVFNDAPPRADRSFRRKRDDNLYLVKARLGYDDGKAKFPLALIHGQKFDLQLNRLTLNAAQIHDFNRLPTPFRAVAANIETGKEVVLQSGNLARSIRASMAVPGAFDPVEIDGRLLVDGGVANNVPVDVARSMGADILIVVNVGSDLLTRDQIKGVGDVVIQLTNFLGQEKVERQLATLKSSDIYIRPELGDLSSKDFKKAGEGIEKGEQSARKTLPALRRLSVDPASYQQLMAKRGVRSREPVIGFVRLDNQSRIGDETILSRVSLKPGQPLDSAQMEADIGSIYGLDVFESVRYELVQEEGETGLLLHAKEKSWGPNYLQFGVELSDNFRGDASYNLGALYTRTAINSLNGEIRLGAQIGQAPSVAVEWHQPLDPASRYFINTKAALSRNQYGLYDGDNITAQYSLSRAGIDLAAGREFGTWGEGRIGYRWTEGNAEVRIGDPGFDDYEFQLGQLYAQLSVDELDNAYFPKHGDKGKLELITSQKTMGADSDYDQALLSWTHVASWGRNTLAGVARFNTTLNDDVPPEALFHAGGFLKLSGHQPNQLSGQHTGLAGVVFYRQISEMKFLPAYLGGSIEYGNAWQKKSDIAAGDGMFNGSLFLGADTPIGPLYLGMGFGEGGDSTAFFYLGPVF